MVRRHGPSLPGGLTAHTLAQRPDFESRVRSLPDTFPEFMHHDAAGHCIPVFLDETTEGLPAGLDEVLERGVEDLERERSPTVVSALLAIVPQAYRGRGLSSVVLNAMKSVASEHGLGTLIAPVRPRLKDRYPLTPMKRYIRWERAEGLPFDPWLRVHRRLGAEFLRVAPNTESG